MVEATGMKCFHEKFFNIRSPALAISDSWWIPDPVNNLSMSRSKLRAKLPITGKNITLLAVYRSSSTVVLFSLPLLSSEF